MIKLFSNWLVDLDEAKVAVPRKKKVAAVAHSDIDRWLKSVDGLAKDLKDLQAAKTKAKDKMAKIGKKFKPEVKEKQENEPKDGKATERTRTGTILPREQNPKPEQKQKLAKKQDKPVVKKDEESVHVCDDIGFLTQIKIRSGI